MFISALTGLAWLIKPALGFVIDNYMSKKFWYALSVVISSLVALTMGIFSLPIIVLIFGLLISSTSAALRDVGADGLMVVEGQEHNICGSIQAWQWIFLTVAGLIVGVLGGHLASRGNFSLGFLLLLPIYAITLLLIKITPLKAQQRKKIALKDQLQQYKQVWTDKRFIFAGLFFFFYCFSPSFGTPLSFLQRDKFLWSEQFIGYLGSVLAVCEIIGAIIYFKVCKKINLKKWLIRSVFIGATVTLLYLYYTPVTCILYGLVFSIVGMFLHLIVMDFVARISIKGIEATTFCLLCSIHNLAGTASNLTGAWLFPHIGLKPLILISAVTSFACFFFLPKLKLEEFNTTNVCKVETCHGH
jgi:MFS family permease